MPRGGDKVDSAERRHQKTSRTKAGKVRESVVPNDGLNGRIGQLSRELDEVLQRQTATSEVLSIIRKSPADAQPVFEAIVQSAARLCGAIFSVVYLNDNDRLRVAATKNFSALATNQINERQELTQVHRSYAGGRAVLNRAIVHIPDVLGDPEYSQEFAVAGGWRAVLAVPLLHEGKSVGAISVGKAEPEPFSAGQVQLLQTFADQAVIAIENVRLFEQVQAKTRDLTESLQQQTATSDVLKIISRSSVDLETVLNTLCETVARLCRAGQVALIRRRDDAHHLVASYGLSAEAKEFFHKYPIARGRGTMSGRGELERRAVHIHDVLQDPEYTFREGQKVGGYRTMLGIPLLRGDELIGHFNIARRRVGPFTDKEIELATTFADQAVIAIENARLFEELRDRQAELRVTFDNMGDGVVMFDAAGRLTAWNRNFQEMIELPEAFLAGRPSRAKYFRYLADRGEFVTADLEAQLGRTVDDTSLEMRYERTRPDGRTLEVRRNPVPGGGYVLIYSDITKRKHAEEALRRRATRPKRHWASCRRPRRASSTHKKWRRSGR